MYTYEHFIYDVAQEVSNLKIHATKDELDKLYHHLLDPTIRSNCYYGLMTGDCHSIRAKVLIKTCARKYVKDHVLTLVCAEGFERISKYINDGLINNFESERGHGGYYSALEAYALLPDAKNENIIAYLKDESETLDI